MIWLLGALLVLVVSALVALCVASFIAAGKEADRRERRERRLTDMLFSHESTPPEVRALRSLAAEAPVNGHREPVFAAEPVDEHGRPVDLAGS